MLRFSVCLLIFCCSCNLQFKNLNQKDLNQVPLITMKRTACYGTCPQYEIAIYKSGLIQYNGKAFVDRLSCFQAVLNPNTIIEIKLYLESINFFQLDTAYISPVTDIPSVITEVNLDNKKHRIVDRLNGPRDLKKIYSLIDSVYANVPEWKKCKYLN